MKLRVKFNKRNYLKYISHLDLMRLFQRSFNRAEVPIKYSKGFNPQPRFSIASPLSLGIESEEEYMDIELLKEIDIEEFKNKMNKVLPEDVQIIDCIYPKDNDAIAAMISWALYKIRFETNLDLEIEEVQNRIDNWLNKDEILISRLRKRGRKKVMQEENIKSLIGSLEVLGIDNNEFRIEALLKTGEKGKLRPFDFVDALNRDNKLDMIQDSVFFKRLGLFIERNGDICKPL